MGVAPENTCLSQEAEAAARGSERDRQPSDKSADPLSYDALLQEYNQLRERSSRTTNALGSAAHDLKTPLSILNGYIELLQNEKLGPLNERQREILGDMHASGQRLQHFIQDFLSYTVLETGEMKMRYETGQCEPLPVRGLPPLGTPLSGTRPGAVLSGQREACRSLPLTRPSCSG